MLLANNQDNNRTFLRLKLQLKALRLVSQWLSSGFKFLFLFDMRIRGGVVLEVDVVEGIGKGGECLFPFVWFQLALPDDDDMPSHIGETLLFLLVTLTVAVDFLLPKLRVGLGHTEVFAAFVSVPEAAVDEHARAILPQHYVGMTGQPWVVQSVSEALSPQVFAHNNFGLRVC